ncbi:AIR synthase [Sulfolobales archaeon HS-7]|nr:AIR synthase [Sulfolobales archaeon HS-7]
MDLEGYTRKLILRGFKDDIVEHKIKNALDFYKGNNNNINEGVSKEIVKEAHRSLEASREPILSYPITGITAGQGGLGSRGLGDFIIHSIYVSSKNYFDDAGVNNDIIASIDGMHSRLSYFPFIAGFHVTRATLRDIMVKGGKPLGLLVDIHLSDDSDIGMLYDFEGGVITVSLATGVPILGGSTLRIGGDLVIGERITGGVGAVGKIGKKFFSRQNIKSGMKIVATKGLGGGTISTIAIYYGAPELVEKTLNLDDLKACRVAIEEGTELVDSMTDVTNGGIRGDANEIFKITGNSIVINRDDFIKVIDSDILKLLLNNEIDPLGISIDSILIFTNRAEEIIEILKGNGIEAKEIGYVSRNNAPLLVKDEDQLKPEPVKFRESPYTPVKKAIGFSSKFTEEEIDYRSKIAWNIVKKKIDNVLKSLSHFND